MSIRLIQSILLSTSTVVFCGCGDFFAPPAAEFSYRAETDELVPELSTGVKEQLVGAFGTPHNLVAWLKLPVDYGGIVGTTQASDLEGPINQFPVTFEEEALEKLKTLYGDSTGEKITIPAGGISLEWLSGPLKGQSTKLNSFQLDTEMAVIQDPIAEIPPEGSEFTLAAGEILKSGKMLYMEHCMHCHGVAGDAAGPTAPYLNPLPRDYRLGLYKFKSTLTPEKINRHDLERTIKYGIPGTYMPSFLLMEPDEMHAIIEYIRWLSMRGELEYRTDNELKIDYSREAMREREKSEEPAELQTEVEETLKGLPELFDQLGADVGEAWVLADESEALMVPPIPRIPDSKESRDLGRMFYLEKCTNCHGHTGLGNGSMTRDYQKNEATQELEPEPGLYNVWGHPVKPRNLQTGVYRGGRRPIDLFWRISGGITPSKMPNFATAPPETIWHAVNYVLHIPFQEKGEYDAVDAAYEAKKKANPDTVAGADSTTAEPTAAPVDSGAAEQE